MIENAIETTQLYIFARFFRERKGTRFIRIFPIALQSKKDGIVRVFNGYKRKYIGRILKEFITIT
jgi:hypothetical protein